MLMGGHPLPALHVAPYGQNVQGGDGGAEGADMLHPRLLPGLPQGHGEQVALPIRMAARPGPHPVNIVVGHEHPGAVGIDHKAGAGQMGDLVVPGENVVRKQADVLQNQPLIRRLLLILGRIGPDFIHIHGASSSGRSHSGRGCPRAPGAPPPRPSPSPGRRPNQGKRHPPPPTPGRFW